MVDSGIHDAHDLGRLVAFADLQLDPEETVVAADQVAGCNACAVLVDDLRLLAAADRALATPIRVRDFRLTADDAARLGVRDEEPLATTARLSRVMPATRPTPVVHVDHDPELIAASVATRPTDVALTRAQRDSVEAWLATCDACVDLRSDLLAIAEAHRALPTPPRPRDLQLGELDAARLRGGRWRDILGWIGGARDGVTRPLATGLTTLGLIGVLVTGAPALLSSSGAASALAPVGQEIGGSLKSGDDADPGDSTVFTGGDNPAAAEGSDTYENPLDANRSIAPGNETPNQVAAQGGSSSAESTPAAVATGLESEGLTATQERVTARDRASLADPAPIGLLASVAAVLAGAAMFAIRRATRPLRGR